MGSPTTPQPTTIPGGETAKSGSWVWNSATNAWQWNETAGTAAQPGTSNKVTANDSNINQAPGAFQHAQYGGSRTASTPSIGVAINTDLGNTGGASLTGKGGPSAKLGVGGINPFNDQYGPTAPYTPFGLQSPQSGGGGQGAFGTTNNSQSVVPQLEQIRMQRILQTYQPYGPPGSNMGGQ